MADHDSVTRAVLVQTCGFLGSLKTHIKSLQSFKQLCELERRTMGMLYAVGLSVDKQAAATVEHEDFFSRAMQESEDDDADEDVKDNGEVEDKDSNELLLDESFPLSMAAAIIEHIGVVSDIDPTVGHSVDKQATATVGHIDEVIVIAPTVGQLVDKQAAATVVYIEMVNDSDPTVGLAVDKQAAATVELIEGVSDIGLITDHLVDNQAAATVEHIDAVGDSDPTDGHAVFKQAAATVDHIEDKQATATVEHIEKASDIVPTVGHPLKSSHMDCKTTCDGIVQTLSALDVASSCRV